MSIESVDRVLFKNGLVADPENTKTFASDVLIEAGKIESVGKIDDSGFDGRIVDIKGSVICPGLIDMHVHLREPGREDEETVESGCEAAMAGGFVAVCPMPNTEPCADSAEIVHYLKNKAKELLVDVYPIAAVTRGRMGEQLTEMGDLVEAGAVAFSDDGDPVSSTEMMRRALEYSKMFDVPIIEHAEDKSVSKNGVMNESRMSTRLGLPGIPGLSEDVCIARDLLAAELTGGRLHIAHISTARSVDLVRQAKKRGTNVTCEVMPHHFVLDDEKISTYDPAFKMNPPLRTKADVVAMLEGLKDGTIDVIATDHAPHSPEEKELEFLFAPFGIVGLETALGLVLKYLVEPGILTLPEAVRKMTLAPADILRLDRGRIQKGATASISIFDQGELWTVDKLKFKSKSKNTPFNGWELKGSVKGLYNNGKLWIA